ncbi:MAG: mechanosensitive ion channel family protein [Bdellovibrionales bacterium]|nr:mechanosensitive ion channel family protein [Bdellovibrionales bacterium]
MTEFFRQIRYLVERGDGWTWLAILCASILLTIAVKAALKLVSVRLRRLVSGTASIWDDTMVDLIDGLRSSVLFIWIFYAFAKSAKPPETIHQLMMIAVVAATVFQTAVWGFYIIRQWRDSILKKKIQKDASSAAALGLLYTSVEALFLIVIVLIGLSNLGVNIAALVAGLGIGGIAVALAAQNVLGDVLASLSIALDKPFIVGDFLVIGSEMGTVEDIGIKTTRVRSLSGEQLIFSNKDLLESRIRNFKRMYQRRVVQKVSVVYSTPREKLEKIPGWIKGFVEKHEKLRFERCHLMGFAASSLDFELVYWVKDPDQAVYMDLQQILLLDIIRKFDGEKISFALPAQSLLMDTFPVVEGQPQHTHLTHAQRVEELSPRERQ